MSMKLFSRNFLHFYQHHLHHRPLLTKAITTGFLYFCGDLIAQSISYSHATTLWKQEQILQQRQALQQEQQQILQDHFEFHILGGVSEEIKSSSAASSSSSSASSQIPSLVSRTFFDSYDGGRGFRMAIFGFLAAGPIFHYWYGLLDSKWRGTAMKSVFTKLALDQIICAPLFDAFFFSALGYMEGKNTDQVIHKLQHDWPSTFLADCIIWPFANGISFRYISPQQRVLFMNVVNLGWTAFLAKKNAEH